MEEVRLEWLTMDWNVDAAKLAIGISVLSAAVALVSVCFAIYSWQDANRPLVSVQVATAEGGNNAISLNLVVENTGNRPAKNIRIVAKQTDVLAALDKLGSMPTDAHRIFYSGVSIPLLIHGRQVTNAFGHLGNEPGAWRSGAVIPVKVIYGGLGWRCYCSSLRLLLADDAGFAQTFWAQEQSGGG